MKRSNVLLNTHLKKLKSCLKPLEQCCKIVEEVRRETPEELIKDRWLYDAESRLSIGKDMIETSINRLLYMKKHKQEYGRIKSNEDI